MLAFATSGAEAAEPAPAHTMLTFAAATNAVTTHPSLPLLAVATGERRYDAKGDGGTSSDDESADDAGQQPGAPGLSVWRLPSSE